MRPKKYPLEPLRRLKKERAETRTRELGAAVKSRETVQRRREEAEREREAERARAEVVRNEERASLENGGCSVKDLARAGAWEQRVSAEDAERARGIERARATEVEATKVETRAQGAVAKARAEVEATSRHEERWRAAVAKSDEAREEEAVADAVTARRRPATSKRAP